MTSPHLLALAQKLRTLDLMRVDLRELQLSCTAFGQSRFGTRDELIDRVTFAIWQHKYDTDAADTTTTPPPLTPDPLATPDHYVVQIHTYTCTNCGGTTQAMTTYAAETLRHVSAGRNGRYIPHMVPTKEFTCNVPVRTHHTARTETAVCSICAPIDGSSFDLSHLPRPIAPPHAHIVGGVRDTGDATLARKSSRPSTAKVYDESILEF